MRAALEYFFILFLWAGPAFSSAPDPEMEIQSVIQSLWLGDEEQRVLNEIYEARQYRPLWFINSAPSTSARQMEKIIEQSANWGLDPRRFHRDWLGTLSRPPGEHFAIGDVMLTSAFLRMSSDLRFGRLNPRDADPRWHIENSEMDREQVPSIEKVIATQNLESYFADLEPHHLAYQKLKSALVALRVRAAGEPGTKFSAASSPEEVARYLKSHGDFYAGEDLTQALKRFQFRHGLKLTGQLDAKTIKSFNVPSHIREAQILANLERWRWLPRKIEDTYIHINVPDFSLQYFRENACVLSMKVVVGRTTRPSPSFKSELVSIEVNPAWHVPLRIAREDLVPELIKDPMSLVQKGFIIADRKSGRTIDPREVEWSGITLSPFPYRFVQKPGEFNALGKVKFWLTNNYGVYLHDTPAKNLFDEDRRTFSSGCIRLEKPFELAEDILKENSAGGLESYHRAIKSGRQEIYDLLRPIPVYLLYWTAWVDEEGLLHFRDDVYSRNRKIEEDFLPEQIRTIAEGTP